MPPPLPISSWERAIDVSPGDSTGRAPFPTSYTRLLALFLALPPLLAPCGQYHGYSPELHMGAFIKVGALALFTLLFGLHVRTGTRLEKNSLSLPLALLFTWAGVSLLWDHNRY